MSLPKRFVVTTRNDSANHPLATSVFASTFTIEGGALVFGSDTGKIKALKEWVEVCEAEASNG